MRAHGTRQGLSAGAWVLLLGPLITACVGPNPYYVAPPEEVDTDTDTGSASASASSTGVTPTDGSGSESESGSESDSDASSTAGSSTSGGGLCGDGSLDEGEECDLGPDNGLMGSGCTEVCTMNLCGNGIVEIGEECDDGNTAPDDGCSPNCQDEPGKSECGDGSVEALEECDDGNQIDNDGCEKNCTKSPPGACGDGILDWDELCDDGNKINGDGCEQDCVPSPDPVCAKPEEYAACDANLDKESPLAPFRAIGAGCPEGEAVIPIAKAQLVSADADAWQLAAGFGDHYEPREGSSFLMLSTGTISAPNGDGVVIETFNSQAGQGNNDNPNDNKFLPDFDPDDDMSGVLSESWALGQGSPNDKIYLTLETTIPKASTGYSLDFAFLSSEWPLFVGTQFSDLLVVWQVSESFIGTVSTIDKKSTSTTSLHPHWSSVPIANGKGCLYYGSDGPGFTCIEPQLVGTGFETHAGTTWLRINQELPPEEEVKLYVFLADMTDSAQASVVLLDRFRYRCEECIIDSDPKCLSEAPDPECCGVVMPT